MALTPSRPGQAKVEQASTFVAPERTDLVHPVRSDPPYVPHIGRAALNHAGQVIPVGGADRELSAQNKWHQVETALLHPARGYIKLEDTLVVSDGGWEAPGDGSRGWNSSALEKSELASA